MEYPKNLKIEEWICANTQDEGYGGVYERISLGRFLNRLCKQLNLKSVLELGVPFSKGYDNMVFIKEGCEVKIADKNIDEIKANWPSNKKPKFSSMNVEGEFDLVWNFALINTKPEIIDEMIKKSKKYVLFFTPNIWNYGTPFHIFYHLITGIKCDHAEKGSFKLRRLSGLAKFAEKKGLKVLEKGYVDMPFWPDTAFGINDIKKHFFGIKIPPKEEIPSIPANEYLKIINSGMFIENSKLPIRYLFAHHQYVLAVKK
jgi:hypothetical protein